MSAGHSVDDVAYDIERLPGGRLRRSVRCRPLEFIVDAGLASAIQHGRRESETLFRRRHAARDTHYSTSRESRRCPELGVAAAVATCLHSLTYDIPYSKYMLVPYRSDPRDMPP